MTSTLKSRIHLAVAAGLMGLATVSAPVVQAAARLSDANVGQALIYPFYTVNDGWITTLNLMNTSAKTVAVKVRFHEMKNSRDVLDFNVIMSPYDSWTAWVEDSDLGTRLRTVDKSCTSPRVVDGANASRIAYTGEFDDTGGNGYNRLREGYVEVVVMGVATSDAQIAIPPSNFDATAAFAAKESLYVPYFSEHVDGVPRDCGIVDRAFIPQSLAWTAPNLPTDPRYDVTLGCTTSTALPGSGYPLASCDFEAPASSVDEPFSPGDNPLKGNVGWLNAATGFGAGSEALAVKDWATGAFVTAQRFPWFLEPTFATKTELWTVDPAEFESTVTATATMNEWADNPVNGARTDWVVTFPTKAFHVDLFNDEIQAAVNKYRNGGVPVVTCTDADDRTTCDPVVLADVLPFQEIFGASTAPDGTGISNITVGWNLFDREEGTVVFESDGTTISPTPPPQVEIATLPYEANVVQFAADESVLGSNFPRILSASAALNGAGSGWALLEFIGETATTGLPVAAFAFRAIDRTQDGQAYDAGYERVPTAATTPE
jgi:hypothetical protein